MRSRFLIVFLALLMTGCGTDGGVGVETPPGSSGQPAPVAGNLQGVQELVLGRGYPVITASPSSAYPGEVVTLTITNVSYGQVKVITIDPTGAPRPSVWVQADSTGTARYRWTAQTPRGYWRFRADNYGYQSGIAYVQVVQQEPLVLSSSASSATTVGESVTFTVTGATPYSRAELYLTAPQGSGTSIQTLYTDAGGRASCSWTAASPAGPWTFAFRDLASGQTSNSLTLDVRGTPLQLSAASSTMVAGQTLPIQISGAVPAAPIYVQTQGPDGNTYPTTLTADPNGQATFEFSAPTPGQWTVTADDQEGGGSNTLSITAEQVPEGAPQLVALDTTVSPGETVALDVTGVPPYSEVRLHVIGPDGAPYETSLTADWSGAASFRQPAVEPLGTWGYEATDLYGRSSEQVLVEVGVPGLEMTATRTTANAGDEVRLDVRGGEPYSKVQLEVTMPDGTRHQTTLPTDPTGNATFLWSAMEPTGTWTFQASDSYSGRTSPLVTVEVSSATGGFRISSTESSAQPNETVALNITGAPPYSEIRLAARDPNGMEYWTHLYTDANACATFLWTAQVPEGDWSFIASDISGNTSNTWVVRVGSGSTPPPAGVFSADRTTVSKFGDRYVNFTLQCAPYTQHYLARSSSYGTVYYSMGTTDGNGYLTYTFDSQQPDVYEGTCTFWASSTPDTSGVRSNSVDVAVTY